jgi:protein gp37
MLECPLQWKSPKRIFVNSMSDLFHEDVPDDFIFRVFEIMNAAHWHQFQVLTKRSHRLCELNSKIQWTPNIWVGVTVECEEYRQRIDDLRNTSANIKFLSCEPLLGPLEKIDLHDIDWVIVGGESGPGSRCMKEKWISSIRDTCIHNNIPFFFKQWGGFNKKRNGRLLQGKIWEQMPCII